MRNLYEAMYIVDPALNEQEVESVTERLKSEIVEKGGEIVDVQHLGKKRLAYPIEKKKDGFYLLLYFRLAPDRLSELKGDYRLADSILRFLILKKREKELQLAGEQTPAAGGREEPEEDVSSGESGESASLEADNPAPPLAGTEEE